MGLCLYSLQFRNTEGKLADITSSIISAVNSRCQCSLTVNHLPTQLFLCISDQQLVLYRAELSGRPDCGQVLSYIEQWVNGSQNSLLVQSNIIEVYHDCPIEVDSLMAEADCVTSTSNTPTATGGMNIIGAIVGVGVGGVLFITMILVALVVLAALVAWCCKQR